MSADSGKVACGWSWWRTEPVGGAPRQVACLFHPLTTPYSESQQCQCGEPRGHETPCVCRWCARVDLSSGTVASTPPQAFAPPTLKCALCPGPPGPPLRLVCEGSALCDDHLGPVVRAVEREKTLRAIAGRHNPLTRRHCPVCDREAPPDVRVLGIHVHWACALKVAASSGKVGGGG